MVINTCIVCEKKFESPNKKEYCSHKCWHEKNYIKQEINHICIYCSKEFTSNRKISKYCSPACSTKYIRREKADIKYCRVCGKLLGKLVNGRVYCSKQCDVLWRKQNPIYPKECLVCGKSFKSNLPKQVYCCKICQSKGATKYDSICKKCGKEFTKRKNHTGKFCSRKCFLSFIHATAYGNKQAKCFSDISSVRRAIKLKTKFERVDVLEVFEWNNWTCQICGEKVDRNLPWPNPMSASLDHIIPFSRGGFHIKENVSLAHLICNIKKGSN